MKLESNNKENGKILNYVEIKQHTLKTANGSKGTSQGN